MVGGNNWPRLTTSNSKSCQLHICQISSATLYILRTECGQAIIGGKTDEIIIGMESHAVDITFVIRPLPLT